MRLRLFIAILLIAIARSLCASPLYQVVPGNLAWTAPAAGTGISISTESPTTSTFTYSNFKDSTVFRCLLAQKVPLPARIQHIAFWVLGADVVVRPIVSDADGEEFTYSTRSQGSGWRYVSTLLVDPYNGRAITNSDIATHSGGDGNGVPNPPLALVGLDITTGPLSSDSISVRDIAFDMSKQSDSFAVWSLNGRCLKSDVPDAGEPFLFASDICPDTGRYHVSWRTTDLSDTRLLWQGEQDLDYDTSRPDSPPSNRVRFPILTPGSYTLNVTVVDRDASSAQIDVRHDFTYRLRILRGVQISPPLPVATRPIGTLISFNPVKQGRVYALSEPKIVTIRFWKPGNAGALTWAYWWRQSGSAIVGPNAPLKFGDKPFVDKTVTLTGWKSDSSPVAAFGASVSSQSAVLDRAETTFGVAQALPKAPLRISATALSHEDVVKKYGNLVTVGNFGRELFDCSQADFQTYVDGLRDAGYNCFIFRLSWRRLNPLPGVADFSILDQRVAYLDKMGMPYIFQINWSFDDQPDWLACDLMADQSGDTQVWDGRQQLPTAADPTLRTAIASLIHLVQGHYLGDKNLIAYEYLGIADDWLQPDAPYRGITVDYSRSARAAFQQYLRTVKHCSIESLNSRYSTSYDRLADVPLPSPKFSADPDFSPQWRDFMDFKRWFPRDYIRFLVDATRSMDQRRYISLYAMGGVWMPLDLCKQDGIYMANGGAEGEHQPAPRFSRELLHGMSDRSESVSCDFASETRLDSDIFNMLSIGGLGTSINNFWPAGTPVYAGDAGAKQKAYWLKWIKILDELKQSVPQVDDVAVIASPDSLFYNDRTVFGDVAWFPEWEQERKIANDENLRPQWVYEDDLAQALPGKRLAVLLGTYSRIIDPDTVPKLVDYVTRGGTLVTDIASGSQIPGAKPYALWTALKLPEPLPDATGFATKANSYTSLVPDGHGMWPNNGTIAFDGRLCSFPRLAGATPLLTDTNGNIVCWRIGIGKGAVIAFPGELDYPKSAPFLGMLYATLGGHVPVVPSQPEIKTVWLKTSAAYYLVAHRYLPPGYIGDASSDDRIRALGVLSGTIALTMLPPGAYTADCLTESAVPPLASSAKALAETGVHFTLHRGETTVWRIKPEGN